LVLLGRRLAVSIPDSVLEDKESQRDKTAKLGLMARACAIYGVDLIEVFRDRERHGEGEAIRRVLEYLETPQYLRKRLYPLDETLRYAGMLPPLRIPSHKIKVSTDRLSLGEVREGVVNSDGTVDIGLDSAFALEGDAAPGKRVTVKVTSTQPPLAVQIPRDRVNGYWGYRVEMKSVYDVISDARFSVKVATSRLGAPIAESLARLRASLRSGGSVKLIFGSPSRGLYDMAGRELDKRVGFVVNLYPEQHVETVRTEEAIFAGLSLVSILSAEKA
jgi:hypothetical protein